jgi:hypothetical protein
MLKKGGFSGLSMTGERNVFDLVGCMAHRVSFGRRNVGTVPIGISWTANGELSRKIFCYVRTFATRFHGLFFIIFQYFLSFLNSNLIFIFFAL